VLILRPYRTSDVAAIRAAFAKHRRVLYVLPTGGGKTVVFAYIVSHAVAKGNTVIILAHRVEIVDQIGVALESMGVAHSRIQPGYDLIDSPMRVGMVKTVARRRQDHRTKTAGPRRSAPCGRRHMGNDRRSLAERQGSVRDSDT
jgi:DNA repair protein RadD